jgi:hypothetical protein
VYLIPCDSKKEYKYLDYVNLNNFNPDNEFLGDPVSLEENQDKNVYFRIDKMREQGYIAEERTKQTDLCILAKWYDEESITKIGGYYAYYTSNRLRFTAEEISNVVQEYDEAGFSQYDGQY